LTGRKKPIDLGFFLALKFKIMTNLTNEETIDINILLALTKCTGEMAHNLQYIHTEKERLRIKQLKKSTTLYETQLSKRFNYSQADAVENIYDVIMDLILDARQVSLENAVSYDNKRDEENRNKQSTSQI
tara:strand:+ start:917 stop:1306 length:390 start_codon:yes stop_codon:yes gene_type:complete